jgi:peptide-methionine (S)-S-oxide reductase
MIKSIVLGGGCFWCVEAVFNELNGVLSVVSGYSGGNAPGHPTYREICSGLTGHAEVIKVEYDNTEISLETIFKVFLTTHDPTTLNRQGADVGTQYRSVIYFEIEDEQKLANNTIKEIQEYYDNPIVTEVEKLDVFYNAEDYHQDYYTQHKTEPYCAAVISPKINKLRANFSSLLK